MKEATAQKILNEVSTSYNTIADEFTNSRSYGWQDFIFFKPYLFENAEIVDLGCGNGRLIKFLDQFFLGNGYRYIGIDNSEKLLLKAQQQFPGKVFLPGNQLCLPLESKQVNLLFNIAAFHHIPSENLRLQALLEMKRVLSKKGILILTVWNLWQWKYLKNNLTAWLESILSLGDLAPNDLFINWKNSQKEVMTSRYYHNFLPWELKSLIKKSGFKILKSFYARNGKRTGWVKGFNYIVIAQNE